ncbi:uncharacterized protein LOC142353735 [Convolutriloba macropyga]|uniref:uncharacterized protein LOC142353735 n=1 Tax=Convolutriloba macropyga TaxID=536237 RepID=UPI003F522346
MVNRIDQLLAALDPVMADSGGIKCSEDIVRVVALMKDMNKLESRCIYLNLILATKNESFLRKFVNAGGWKIMNQWLADITCEQSSEKLSTKPAFDCNLFIEDVLRALKNLPVSVEILKQNATPRLVKNLSKDSKMSSNVQLLAGQVVEMWMNVIKAQSDSPKSNPAISKQNPSHAENISKSSNKKQPDSAETKHEKSVIDKLMSKQKHLKQTKLIAAPKLNPELSLKNDKTVSNETKGDKSNKRHSSESGDSKSPTAQSQLEVAKAPEAKKAKLQNQLKVVHQSIATNPGHDFLGQLKQGMSRTKMEDLKVGDPIPKKEPISSPVSVTPEATKPAVQHNVPPKPKAVVRQISLCDDMFKPAEVATPSPAKKKKKIVTSGAFPNLNKSGKTASKSNDGKKEGGSSTGAKSPNNTAVIPTEIKAEPGSDVKVESVVAGDGGDVSNPPADGKKRVKWKIDDELVAVKVYELDDEERAMKSIFGGDRDQNAVENLRDEIDITKREMLLERKIRQQQTYSGGTTGGASPESAYARVGNVLWRLIPLELSDEMKTVRGQCSKERDIQNVRERHVLSEIYPNLLTIPSSPKEPDLSECYRPTHEPVIIPYDDIEPQGMEIDSGAEDEDERIFQEYFPGSKVKAEPGLAGNASGPSTGIAAVVEAFTQPQLASGAPGNLLTNPVQTTGQATVGSATITGPSLPISVGATTIAGSQPALSLPLAQPITGMNGGLPLIPSPAMVLPGQNSTLLLPGSNQYGAHATSAIAANLNSVVSPNGGTLLSPPVVHPNYASQQMQNAPTFNAPPFANPMHPNPPFHQNSFQNAKSIGQRGASYDNGFQNNPNNAFNNQQFPHNQNFNSNFSQNNRNQQNWNNKNNFHRNQNHNGPPIFCKYFAQGKCHHGNTCRYSHDVKKSQRQQSDSSPIDATKDYRSKHAGDSRKSTEHHHSSRRKDDPRRDNRKDSDYRRDSPKNRSNSSSSNRHKDSDHHRNSDRHHRDRDRDHRDKRDRSRGDSKSSDSKSSSPKDSPKSKTKKD